MSFHKVLPACVEGDANAWRVFLADYSPIVDQLFRIYLPLSREEQNEFWREILIVLSANDFERLRGFEHQAEREFLVDLRAWVLDRARTKLDPSGDATLPPRPTGETLTQLLKGLPLLHQEVVLLTLAGYSPASLEKLLRITPAVAGLGLARLKAEYALVLDRSEDRCLWPAAWIELIHLARVAKKGDCATLRQLVRILEGQASWYEKSPVEEHRSSCLHCLEKWTSLQEVVHWKREGKPWPRERIEPLLNVLPLRADQKPRKSVLTRILGK
jgi:hypothetical protein